MRQLPEWRLVDAWHASILDEDRERIDETSRSALRGGEPGYRQEYRYRQADGEIRWVDEEARKADLLAHLSAVTRAVVLGTLLTAVAQGTLLGIGFAMAGLPSPVVFGVLSSIVSLVPMVGTALVWIPAVGVLLIQERLWASGFLLVWSLALVGTIDNVLKPLVVSGRAQISTLPVFLGLMGGLSAFGAIGMVLGPVIVALMIALLQFAEESRPTE